MRNNVAKALFEIAKNDKDVILIIGDLGYGVMNKFWEELPNQFINAGISEQNMISLAAGLSIEGKKVYVYSIANFPTLRPFEQIRNDVCYHNANVKIISVGGGFAYGSLGMSHHGTEDLAVMRALPNMKVFSPCDANEAIAIVNYTQKITSPCYIRLGKGGEPNIHTKEIQDFTEGKALKVLEGANQNAVVLCTGAIISEALKAYASLKEKNAHPTIYSFPTIKPIDETTIKECATRYKKIITLEEHNIVGGFGSAVAEVMSGIEGRAILKRIGINDCYSSIVGSQSYLRDFYNINSKALIEEITF